ncbi:uncharacterized protein LOC135698545 [Ochlerotatus camptorhynchus]|uniref:uncharacterized protein LOC135698545 n=1 Tax=Ochlerotatus camptorhynchus TaxID=644619 RepID=UPI0031CFC6D8
MPPYNVPQTDAYSVPSSPLGSDTNSNHSSGAKKIKYDSNYENMIFRAGYANMQNEYIYNQQRKHALKVQDDRLSITSTSSVFSSMDGYPSTPSPDFALSLSQTSSPLFMGYQHTPADPPPLRYFQPATEIQSPVSIKASAEHNYAVDSPNRSASSPEAGSELLTPEPARKPARGRILSDSGHSTIPEPDEINPLCMNDWFRDAVRPAFMETLQQALTRIDTKSAQQKEQYIETRIIELPTDLEYNPNKSRLRKVYESPTEAAERERNNLASRKSRFKKKIAQQITNMHLEFDRNENSDLYAMQNWMGQVIFELESLCLDNGLTIECLLELRRQCGFSQSNLDKMYTAGSTTL